LVLQMVARAGPSAPWTLSLASERRALRCAVQTLFTRRPQHDAA